MANWTGFRRWLDAKVQNRRYAKHMSQMFIDLFGGAQQASFTVNAEDTNEIIVNVQLSDENGDDVEERCAVLIMVSNDANGDAFNDDDYTIAAGTDGDLVEAVADKLLFGISEADGDLDISLTITGAATSYLHVFGPNGKIIGTSGAITHAA